MENEKRRRGVLLLVEDVGKRRDVAGDGAVFGGLDAGAEREDRDGRQDDAEDEGPSRAGPVPMNNSLTGPDV